MSLIRYLSIPALAVASPLLERQNNPAPGVNCPGNLKQPYHVPVEVIQVSQLNPDQSFGNSFPHAQITPGDICTIQKFVNPASSAGQTCTGQFVLPFADQLANGATYTYETVPVGGGHFQATSYLGSTINDDVTYATTPTNKFFEVTYQVQPGQAAGINFGGYPGSCLANYSSTASNPVPTVQDLFYWVQICSNDTTLQYDISDQPCLIGGVVSQTANFGIST